MYDLKDLKDVDPGRYEVDAESHDYVETLSRLNSGDVERFLEVGVDTSEKDRIGTFLQKDKSIVHCRSGQEGVEMMGISDALKKDGHTASYLWKNVSPELDKFTKSAKEWPHEGYYIRSRPGFKSPQPVQSCLYIAKDGFSQNVHNLAIAEADSELHVITGCASAKHVISGLHIGVSEFYVKKGARLTFTMIHDWGENVFVRPRTVVRVEEGGVFVSNFICLKPVGSLQMFPTVILEGQNSVARSNSILVAGQTSELDVGSRIILEAAGARAEIISRGITYGGTIIARGDLVGKTAGIKAHLECKGLILNNGLMKAIPELSGYEPGVEMSHEAAVGKIDQREIEYLMSRGLDEDEAVSTIVRGFLNVNIDGLPPGLQEKLDKAVADTQKDMM